MIEPLVTVVVTPREGHFMVERSLLTLLADDAVPFDLIYVDFDAPAHVSEALRRRAAEHSFRLIELPEWTPPSLARAALLPEINTKYVAFADNDILVERGCLEALVACAEETGAGLASPLYIQAGGGRQPSIHMAGGIFDWSDEPEPRVTAASHRWSDAPLETAAGAGRERVDFTEYHYVLARMDLLRGPGVISDEVLLVHEHLDLALVAREQGWPVLFEPAAKVTYLAFEPRPIADAGFYRRRWDVGACQASADAFARRWGVDPSSGLIAQVGVYAAERLQEMSVRRWRSASADLDAPMRRDELAQSRFALREQALTRGYPDADVARFESACDLATLLFDGLYRPDGRPFLSHVLGTASALVRYDIEPDVVVAGLLHAALTHRPDWIEEQEVAGALRASGAEALVRSQPATLSFLGGPEANLGALNIVGVRTAVILAANDIDMRLSGEYRATGRPGDLTPVMRARIASLLAGFGVDGLFASVAEPDGDVDARPMFGAPARHVSFRLDARNRKILPV